MSILQLAPLAVFLFVLCEGSAESKTASHVGAVVDFEPHFQRLNSPGQYPYGLRPDLSEIRNNLGVLFFGRKKSGKTRLIEKLLRASPWELSGTSSTRSQLYATQLPHALLYVADCVAFQDETRTGYYAELRPVLDLRNEITKARVPLKRIYYVIDASDTDSLNKVSRHLESLKVALGVEAASSIRFVVNKCDRVSLLGKAFFHSFEERLQNQFREVFNIPLPRVLFVAAAHVIGQLYDDIIQASTESSLTLSTEDGISLLEKNLERFRSPLSFVSSSSTDPAAVLSPGSSGTPSPSSFKSPLVDCCSLRDEAKIEEDPERCDCANADPNAAEWGTERNRDDLLPDNHDPIDDDDAFVPPSDYGKTFAVDDLSPKSSSDSFMSGYIIALAISLVTAILVDMV